MKHRIRWSLSLVGESGIVASLWGIRCVDDLDLSFISQTPTDLCIFHNCYPPIVPIPLHVPYFSELPLCLSTSLVLCLGQLVRYSCGDRHHLLFGVLDLSSGLSFDQMVGFGLVHIGSWVRINYYLIIYHYHTSTVLGKEVHSVYLQ